jgi:anti-sigma-K factor RskA
VNADVHTLVGAYVLDAVTPNERAEFEAHLAECDECRDEVASLRAVTGELAQAQATAPPDSLRASVLDAIAVTPQASPTPHEATPASPLAPRKRRTLPWAVAAASALAVGGLGFGMAYQDRQESAAMERDVMMVASAPDAHTMDLELGNAHLVVSDKMDGVAAMGQDAPMPADGMEYQMWLMMEDGTTAPGPTFMPSKTGEFMTVMHTPLDGVVGFAVTEEPAGGSTEMTGTKAAEIHL